MEHNKQEHTDFLVFSPNFIYLCPQTIDLRLITSVLTH